MSFAKVLNLSALLFGVLTAALYGLYRMVPSGALEACAITAGTFFYHFAMRLLVGAVVPPMIPQGVENNVWFQQKGWEPGLYKALRVKKWKNRMPTYNPDSFNPQKRTWAEILHNGCTAEAGHGVIMLLSFAPVLTVPAFGAAGVFWITSILAAMMDGCFAVMQRFNRPRIQKLMEKERGHR